MTPPPAWWRPSLAWGVLALALLLSVASWRRISEDVAQRSRAAFAADAGRIALEVRQRIDEYEAVLRAAAGLLELFPAADQPSWRRFVAALELERRYPDELVIAVLARVPASELQRHVASMQARGFPDYTVRPSGARPEYVPILYFEPSRARPHLMGYDIYAERRRRSAAARARDTGMLTATRPLQLVSDLGEASQPAIIMFYPLYDGLTPPASRAARRARLRGFVGAAFRLERLMRSIPSQQLNGVHAALYDRPLGGGSRPSYGVPPLHDGDAPDLSKDFPITIGDRTWTLILSAGDGYDAQRDSGEPMRVLFGGMLVSVLLFGVVRMQSRAEYRARALAETMTTTLAEREARLRAIVDTEPECVKVISAGGRVLEMNAAGLTMMGAIDASQVLGRAVLDLVHPDDREAYQRLHDRVADGATGTLGFRMIDLRGELHWMESIAVPLREGDEARASVLSVTRDLTARRQAEERARQSTAELEAVFRAIPDLFFLTDLDGKILDYRGGSVDDLYMAPSDFLGRRMTEVLPLPVSVRLDECIAQVRQHGRPVSCEYELATPSGYNVFEARLHPLGSDQIVLIARNVTQRRRAEDALRASEAQYRRIVETAYEGICVVDAEYRTTFVNRRLATLLGYEPTEMLGRSAFDFMAPEATAIDGEWVHAWHESGTGQQHEYPFKRRDGAILWTVVSAQPIFDEHGRYAGALGMITDISERKEAEDAYRRSQALVTSIVENTPNLIFVKRATDLRYVLVNRACELMIGRPRAEIIGRTDYDFFPVEQADFFIQKDREALGKGEMIEIPEEPLDAPGKGLRWVRTVKVPIFDDAGRPQYLLGITEDITDRRHLEDHVRQAQKLEAIGTLAGGIAHDFNNILGCIIGFSELARRDVSDNATAIENIDNVLEAGHRAKELVEQIMSFSRSESPQREPLDPGPVVAGAVKLLRAVLPASIELRVSIGSDLPFVLGDATQIHQVVTNLSTNAAQAVTEQGGLVEIRLERATVRPDAPSAVPAGVYARILVRDTGRGMDALTMERAFEPFFTTKAPGRGTGLGLSVVHGIVRAHGGSIVVRSRPGRGSTFVVYLPAYDGARPSVLPAKDSCPQGHGEHILFVDDEAPLVSLGRSALRSLGYRVTGLTDPVEAVATFRAQPDRFDLVVTDLSMPALSGTELARTLLTIRPDLPIVLITGFGGHVTPEAARSIGLRGLVAKPSTMNALGHAVHGALAGRPD